MHVCMREYVEKNGIHVCECKGSGIKMQEMGKYSGKNFEKSFHNVLKLCEQIQCWINEMSYNSENWNKSHL